MAELALARRPVVVSACGVRCPISSKLKSGPLSAWMESFDPVTQQGLTISSLYSFELVLSALLLAR